MRWNRFVQINDHSGYPNNVHPKCTVLTNCFNHQEDFDIFGNGNDDKLSAKLISRKDDTTSLWTLKMLCSFKSPPPSHNEENHHKQRFVPLLMRWSKTLAHICNPRNLDLAAPTLPWCTGLLQPSTSTVLVKHLNSSNPHPPPLPPSSCFYYFKLECTVCIVLSVFGCVRFWRRAVVARIYVVFIFIPELWMLCIRTTSKKIQESIFGQILCQQNFSSTSLVVFIIGQLSLCPVTTFQDFINFIF